MKKIVLTILSLCLGTFVFAENILRSGIQLGTNMESADGYTFDVGAHADTFIFPDAGILLGMQMDFTVNSSSWSSNPSVYLEWLTPLTLANVMTPFVKGNLGVYVYHDDNKKNNKSGCLASLSAGMNFDLGERFYVAPAFAFGYPFMWEASVSAGMKFKIKDYKPRPKSEKAVVPVEEDSAEEAEDLNYAIGTTAAEENVGASSPSAAGENVESGN